MMENRFILICILFVWNAASLPLLSATGTSTPLIYGFYANLHDRTSIEVKSLRSNDEIQKLSDYFISDNGYLNDGQAPVVVIRFEDTLLTTGWGILDLETNAAFEDQLQAYVAGFAEGYVTAHHIFNHSINVASYFFSNFNTTKSEDKEELTLMPRKLRNFLEDQEKWTQKQVHEIVGNLNDEYEEAHDGDENWEFWLQVGLLMEQFEGLVDGYAHRVTVEAKDHRKQDAGFKKMTDLPRWVFQMLNSCGDLNDLIPALLSVGSECEMPEEIKKSYDYLRIGKKEAEFLSTSRSHCSAIIKVLPGNEDLLVGHNTWFSYTWTNRIFKHYSLNYNHKSTAAKGISFSSYPGFLESLDDFYMMSSGLTMTQTSIGIMNTSIYQGNISPESLLAWQRVRVASTMATSGPSYSRLMQKHFSGTYANQYMVVDFNRFVPGRDLDDDTLYVIEEIPGLIVGADQTEILRYGYWPSYNVPVYDDIFVKSGYKAMVDKFGAHQNRYSHSLAPRAEIFRRDNDKVDSLAGLKQLLRYNDFKWDNYSMDADANVPNPSLTLCARSDLYPNTYLESLNLPTALKHKGQAYGCFDAKVTSFRSGAMQRKAEIIAGPTSKVSMGASYLEPFTWNSTIPGIANASHFGLPDVYNFSYMPTKPFYQDNQKRLGHNRQSKLELIKENIMKAEKSQGSSLELSVM